MTQKTERQVEAISAIVETLQRHDWLKHEQRLPQARYYPLRRELRDLIRIPPMHRPRSQPAKKPDAIGPDGLRAKGWVTIHIQRRTRDRLDALLKDGQSYDNLIFRILEDDRHDMGITGRQTPASSIRSV